MGKSKRKSICQRVYRKNCKKKHYSKDDLAKYLQSKGCRVSVEQKNMQSTIKGGELLVKKGNMISVMLLLISMRTFY